MCPIQVMFLSGNIEFNDNLQPDVIFSFKIRKFVLIKFDKYGTDRNKRSGIGV